VNSTVKERWKREGETRLKEYEINYYVAF